MRFILQAFVGVSILLSLDAGAQTLLIGVTNTTWRYLATGEDPGASWNAPSFDDSGWPSGRGLFGNETGYPYPMATPVLGTSLGGPLTAYYRTRFTWSTGGPVILYGTNHVDDGCVVYLNGVEITRFNMPPGPPGPMTTALFPNPGGFPNLNSGEPVSVQMEIPLNFLTNGNANPLVVGENVLAVEVHQISTANSDHVFGLSLHAIPQLPCHLNLEWTNRVVQACQPVEFKVWAWGCFLRSLQWYYVDPNLGPTAIPGATNPTYTLSYPNVTDSGWYFCQVQTFESLIRSVYARLEVLPVTNAPTVQVAYKSIDVDNEFHVIFDQPVRLPGGDNDPLAFQILYTTDFFPGIDMVVNAAYLTNGNELVLRTAMGRPTAPVLYWFNTLRDIAHRCGDGVLPAGTTTGFRQQYRLVDFRDARIWRYHDTGVDPGPNWMMPGFDDSNWQEGIQVFDRIEGAPRSEVAGLPVGTMPALTNIKVNPPAKIPTYLFRCPVTVPRNSTGYVAQVIHDDGFILYVNGREVYRRGLVSDSFQGFGGTSQDPGDSSQQPFSIPATNFNVGENLVAVLLKQADPSSGDVTLGLQLSAFPQDAFSVQELFIRRHPASQRLAEGHRWAIGVEVGGVRGLFPVLGYRWYHDGLPLSLSESPFYQFPAAELRDAGEYRVEVRDLYHSVTSSVATVQVEPVVLRCDSTWRYRTNSQDATLTTVPWFAVDFDDSQWPAGPAPFLAGATAATLARLPCGGSSTELPSLNQDSRTDYFRKRVTVPPIPSGQTLVLCHTVDDGAAFYIDGELVARYNLTNSFPIHSTNAAAGPVPGDGNAVQVCVPVSLAPGEHLIAVEVHQAESDNSDVVFGMELRFAATPTPISITGPSSENLYSLGWNRDPFWDLLEGTSIEGPYRSVAEYPFSSYVIPATGTNRFYRFRFNGR